MATSTKVTSIAICDDHPVAREGLVHIIEGAAGFSVESCTGSALELLAALDRTPIDICILDLGLPDRNGVEVIPEILGRHPGTGVLVFTNHPAAGVGLVCVEAGAHGFVSKGAAPSEIVTALCAVRRGDVHLPQDLVNALVRRRGPEDPHHRLSPREWEVFIRIANGGRISEVAADLHLDQRTVTTYRRRVLDKLGVDSNAALVAYAIVHGLIDANAVATGG